MATRDVPNGTIAWWAAALNKLGYPTMMFLAIGALFWFWVRPWADRLIESHLTVVENVQNSQAQIADSIDQLCEVMEVNTLEVRAHREWSKQAVEAIRHDVSDLRSEALKQD